MTALALIGFIAILTTAATWFDRLPRNRVKQRRDAASYGDSPTLPRPLVTNFHASGLAEEAQQDHVA